METTLTSSPMEVREMLMSMVCSPYWPVTSTHRGMQGGGMTRRKSVTSSWRLWNPVRTRDSLCVRVVVGGGEGGGCVRVVVGGWVVEVG